MKQSTSGAMIGGAVGHPGAGGSLGASGHLVDGTMRLAALGMLASQAPASPLPHIEPHEAPVAEHIVFDNFRDLCGKYPPRVAGYHIGVRIHQRDPLKKITLPDGSVVDFLTHTDRTTTEDKYQSVVGLVVAVGPQAYKGTNFDGTSRYPEGPWCRIGDWVLFPRYEGFQITYRNVPLMILPDDKILGVVEDPDDVIATHLKDR